MYAWLQAWPMGLVEAESRYLGTGTMMNQLHFIQRTRERMRVPMYTAALELACQSSIYMPRAVLVQAVE